jgi:hypothetical protein
MQAAIDRGPHQSATSTEAITQLREEVHDKVRKGQARVVDWETIKHNPPPELKISPISMIPHKSRRFRTILDLSFSIRLQDGTHVPSVNASSVKTAPQGAINQLGHSLSRIIHAFASTSADEKVMMAKWDIKDGFWRLDCEAGQEWNFAYVLPRLDGPSTELVIPTSLQMGWIESPSYFCAASETARDVAECYVETPVGSMSDHKFLPHTQSSVQYNQFPSKPGPDDRALRYLIDVYVDDFIGLVIPTCKQHMDHVANGVMCAVHEVFPPDADPAEDPISLKKLLQGEGSWDVVKDILGFVFNGDDKTVWLSDGKRDALITTIKEWLRSTRKNARFGVPFAEFRSVIYKVRHAFMALPAGKGLLSPFYKLLGRAPPVVFPQKNKALYSSLEECVVFLRETASSPTLCRSLVMAWPDIVGVTDASSFGVGGIIVGERWAIPPTVFRYQWPDIITQAVKSDANPNGTLTNSDLEMAALLLLFLVIEGVVGDIANAHVALYSDNSPSVHWVQRLAVKSSTVAMQLIQALALRIQVTKASPLTTLHISGGENAMTDIPSRSFGSTARWNCPCDTSFLTLYNSTFPLPNQESWTAYRLSSKISTRVISILLMRDFSMAEWRRLPRPAVPIGKIGSSLSNLWEWTLTYRALTTSPGPDSSQGSQPMSDQAMPAVAAKSQLQQCLRRSQPLARRSPWLSAKTLPNWPDLTS